MVRSSEERAYRQRSSHPNDLSSPSSSYASLSFQGDPMPDLRDRLALAHISTEPHSQSIGTSTSAIYDNTPSPSPTVTSPIFSKDLFGTMKPSTTKSRPSKSFGDQFGNLSARFRRVTQSSIKSIFPNPASSSTSSSRPRHFSSEGSYDERVVSQSSDKPFTMRKRPRTASTPVEYGEYNSQLEKRSALQHPHMHNSPVANIDPSSGAAARQFARDFGKLDPSYLFMRHDSGISASSRSQAMESGIDLVQGLHSDSPLPDLLTKKDPVEHLPLDLSILVFSHLDAISLTRCEGVSRTWQRVAKEPWVWRGIFTSQYGTPVTDQTQPAPVGGQGLGKIRQQEQRWKTMYRARRELESRWRKGKASAIYMVGHTDSVYCVQYDEKKVITGSRDRTIRVWDIVSGRLKKVIGVPAALTNDIREASTASPANGAGDVPKTASGLPVVNREICSRGARITNSSTSDDLYHVPEYYHNASVLCLQYDDEICVTGSSDRSLIMWDMATWQPIRRLSKHAAGVLDVAFDAVKIISCSKDGTICIWDRVTGECLLQMNGHQGPVNAVQLRNNLVVSASGEGCAKLWNVRVYHAGTSRAYATATPVKDFKSIRKGLACVEFSDDGKYVYAGGGDELVFKYSTLNGELEHVCKGHTALVRSLYLDCKNKRMVSGSYDLSIRVWDLDTNSEIQYFGEQQHHSNRQINHAGRQQYQHLGGALTPTSNPPSRSESPVSSTTGQISASQPSVAGAPSPPPPSDSHHNIASPQTQHQNEARRSPFHLFNPFLRDHTSHNQGQQHLQQHHHQRSPPASPPQALTYQPLIHTAENAERQRPQLQTQEPRPTGPLDHPMFGLPSTPAPPMNVSQRLALLSQQRVDQANNAHLIPQPQNPGLATSWILSAKSDYRRIVGTSQDGRAIILDFGYGIPGISLLAEE